MICDAPFPSNHSEGRCVVAESADSTLMLEILKEIRKEQREFSKELRDLRTETRDQRTLLLLTSETVAKLHRYTEEGFFASKRGFLNIEERMKSHKDDLEMMVKAELLGSLAQFQTRIENYVEQRLAQRSA